MPLIKKYKPRYKSKIDYPKFEKKLAEFYRAELSEGDLIFIPAFWWHQVHTCSDQIAVNMNWWYVNSKAERKNLKQTISMWYMLWYRRLLQKHLT